jgi:hypothetical protein
MTLMLEQVYSQRCSILSDDPMDLPVALLIEDTADEWLDSTMFDFR